MNFLGAVKHAMIGYGIRRKAWNPKAILYLDNNSELRWLPGWVSKEAGLHNDLCPLLGNDKTSSLTEDDIRATDWEAV